MKKEKDIFLEWNCRRNYTEKFINPVPRETGSYENGVLAGYPLKISK